MAINMPVLVEQMKVVVDLGVGTLCRETWVKAEYPDDSSHKVDSIHPHVTLPLGYGGGVVIGAPVKVEGLEDPKRLVLRQGEYCIEAPLKGEESYAYLVTYACLRNGHFNDVSKDELDQRVGSTSSGTGSWISFRAVKPVEDFCYMIEPGIDIGQLNYALVQKWWLRDGVWKVGDVVPIQPSMTDGLIARVGGLVKGEAVVAMFSREPFVGAWCLED